MAGDQPANAQEAEHSGFGLNLPFVELTEEKLTSKLNQMLTDDSFTKRVKELGSALTDQINKPLDRAVWWLEYVLRHPGAHHLRSPVHDLAWYQYFLLDVIALYVAVLAAVVLAFVKLVKCCCCRRKSGKTVDTGKKRK